MSLPPCWSSCAEALPLTCTRCGPESNGCDAVAVSLGWVEQAAMRQDRTRAAPAARALLAFIEWSSWGRREGRAHSASLRAVVAIRTKGRRGIRPVCSHDYGFLLN